MKFRASFVSGDAIIGTIDFEAHWDDFIQQYESDQVLQKKIWFENQLGCSVSVRIEPIKKLRLYGAKSKSSVHS